MTLWDTVADNGTMVEFERDTVLVHHGETGTHCYAIVEGEVVVTATTKQGARVVLGRRGPGTIIGEYSALQAGVRSATVEARTPVKALVLTSDELERVFLDEPRLALQELRRLSHELRLLTQRYAVRGEELQSRLAEVLITHSDETGDESLRSTRQELADWVGATREAVIRALKELESLGLVRLSRGAVEIMDRDRLRHVG